MRVFKNLFGDGSKINASEIVFKKDSTVHEVDQYLENMTGLKVEIVPFDNDDIQWHYTPDREFRVFYIPGDGQDRGYPVGWAMMLHSISSGTIYQLLWTNNSIYVRRGHQSASKNWSKI